MLERATDRGQTAIRLARRHTDACRQPEVDTLHLLLGLLEEGTGVAATALGQLGVDLVGARPLVPKGEGPERESVRELPLSAALQACIQAAETLMEQLEHAYVSTEHLLLGLLLDPSGAVPELLQRMQTSPAKVKQAVYDVLGEKPPEAISAIGEVAPDEAPAPEPPSEDAERWRRADQLLEEIDGHRPFTPEVTERLRVRMEPLFLFASSSIGRRSTLSLNEVQAFLEREVVSGGHPLQRYLELQRHQSMFVRVQERAQRGAPFELAFVRELHAGLGGKEQPSDWRSKPSPLTRRKGHEFAFAPPEQVEPLMIQLGATLAEVRRDAHPIRAAAWLYHQLFRISPFERGNGRVIRLLVSCQLENHGYPPLVIAPGRLGALLDALVACQEAADTAPDQLARPEHVGVLGDLLATCLQASGERVLAVARGEDLQAHELPAAVARGQEESLAKLLQSGEVTWRVTAGSQVRALFERVNALAQLLPCSGPLYGIELEDAEIVPGHRVAGSALARALPVGDAGVIGLVQLRITPSQETPGLRFPAARRMRLAVAASQLGLHVVTQWDEDRPVRADGPAEAEAWSDDLLNASLTRSVDGQRKAYELAILDANLGREDQRKIRRTLRLQRQQPLPPTRQQEPVSADSPQLDPVAAAPPSARHRSTRRIPSADSLPGLSSSEPPLEF